MYTVVFLCFRPYVRLLCDRQLQLAESEVASDFQRKVVLGLASHSPPSLGRHLSVIHTRGEISACVC